MTTGVVLTQGTVLACIAMILFVGTCCMFYVYALGHHFAFVVMAL